MSIIDTHAHVYDTNVYNVYTLIDDLKKYNISKVFLPGTNLDDDEQIKNLVLKDNKIFYPMIGVHPENIDSTYSDKIKEIEVKISEYKYIAIGEVGLDYYLDLNNHDEQKKFLNDILDIAIDAKLPVSIHSRNAFEDTYNILKLKSKKGLRGVIHCFSGSVDEARKYIDIGFYLGIGGILTFKNSKLKETLASIEINNIVLETDSPYLSPEPLRGTTNSPCNLIYVVDKLIEIYNIDKETIENKINQNIENIFKIS